MSVACAATLMHTMTVRASGRAPAPPAPMAPAGSTTAHLSDGKQLFRAGQYEAAVPVFTMLHERDPDNPWYELYLRVSRNRVEQVHTAGRVVIARSRPAILEAMGLPPVAIRPVKRSAPPAEAIAVPVEEQPLTMAARPVTTPPPRLPMAGPPEIVEPDVPYPQDVALPPPGPVTPPPSADMPVQAHADLIEFSPESKRVIGQGHVRVTHENVVLTCDRVIVFTETRDVLAEGHVRLVDREGVITGDTVYYNFTTHKGTVLNGGGQFFPWYSRGPHLVRTSEHTLLMHEGYLTTCDLDPPHYRFQTKHVAVHLDNKVVAKHVWFMVGERRLWYFPRWSHSLRENRQKWSFFPGKKKPWGAFLLGKYRYEINANAKGSLHWDWRENFGHAQGIDYKYVTRNFGYGLFRTYYNRDADKTKKTDELLKGQDENRYRTLWRHRLDLDPATNVVVDLQEFSDVDFRRDFLFREEFDTETDPQSFALLTHTQPTWTFTTQFRKRMARFQNETELLPEVKWELIEQRLQDTRLFYHAEVTGGNYNLKRAHSDHDDDANSVDFFNRFRYALRLFHINITPEIGVRQTYYSKDKQGGSARPDGQRNFFRGVFSFATNVSTKLFRVFDVDTDALGLNIRGLRHVITPTFSYRYTHDPTVPNDNLFGFGPSAGIEKSNAMTVGLENKIQVKQLMDGEMRKVDLARFLLSGTYTFKPEGSNSRWGSLTADLELEPLPWMRIETDISYDHVLNDFSTWNLDLVLSSDDVRDTAPLLSSEIREQSTAEELVGWGESRWFVGLGHRYEREVRSEMTFQARWQPHPKWWMDYFTRFTYKDVAGDEKRINRNREYQIILTRDLHDWLVQMTVGEDRDLGGIFLLSFVLKAFPELPVSFEDEYHRPKQGSQSGAFYQGTSYYRP